MQNLIEAKTCEILKRYPVKKAAFFGSVLSDSFNENSDVDIIIEFAPNTPGIEFFGLKVDLEEELGRSVDLMTFGALNKSDSEIKFEIEKGAYIFYGK